MLPVFFAVVLLCSMSSVAFANDAPLNSTSPPFTIDFTGIDFTPEQAEFFKSWVDSPYSALVINGSLDAPKYLYFYVFNSSPSYSCRWWADDTRLGLSLNHGGYKLAQYYLAEGSLYTSVVSGGFSRDVIIWERYNKECSRFLSGSLFASPVNSIVPYTNYLTDFGEIAIVDDTDIFDNYVSPFPILPKLTINYKYADGSKAAPTFQKKYSSPESFSIPSPAILGCTARTPVVSGSIVSTDVTVDVVYDFIEYNVMVNYQYTDGLEALPPAKSVYHLGDTYSIESPLIDGFTPDIPTVSGSITETSETNIEHVVTYRDTSHKITVNYLYEDGRQAALPFAGYFGKGDSYEIISPRLSGFIPSLSIIRGVLASDADANTVFNVVYRVDRAIVSADDFDLFTSGFLEVVGLVTVVGCTLFAVFVSVKLIVKIICMFIC